MCCVYIYIYIYRYTYKVRALEGKERRDLAPGEERWVLIALGSDYPPVLHSYLYQGKPVV